MAKKKAEDPGRWEDPSRSDPPGGRKLFPSAEQDRKNVNLDPETPQTLSPAYRLGFADPDFLLRDELRSQRLQLEFLKPDLLQRDRGITATVVFFGSARIASPQEAEARLTKARKALKATPDDPAAIQEERVAQALLAKSRYYDEARDLARMISALEKLPVGDDACRLTHEPSSIVITTGGGPGIMEAANRGAHDVSADSVGHNIVLPFEQRPNSYITPHLSFNFHYFAMRKMHFLLRAIALVVFPGGFGTMDEMFEVLTLVQTQKIKRLPILLFGREFWDRIVDFKALVDEGVISERDLELFQYVETAQEAWEALKPAIAEQLAK